MAFIPEEQYQKKIKQSGFIPEEQYQKQISSIAPITETQSKNFTQKGKFLGTESPKEQQVENLKKFIPSVVKFGQSIGETGALLTGTEGNIKKTNKIYIDSGNQLMNLALKTTDPERKKKLINMATEDFKKAGNTYTETLPTSKKTGKEIGAEALGTLGTVALAGTPAFGGALGRIAFGTIFGAGVGTKKGLEQNKENQKIVSDAIKGGIIGGAISGTVEAVGLGLRTLAKTKPVKGFTANIFNRELQPETKELVSQIKRHADTTGEKVISAVDNAGKPIYRGGYSTLQKQAEEQIKNNSTLLRNELKDFSSTSVDKNLFKRDLINKLEDVFGYLDDTQQKIINKEFKNLPPKMNLEGLLDQRQIVDSKIPDNMWIEVDPRKAFVGNVRYYLRGIMKKAIEDFAPTVQVKTLNQKIGLALDVKDLVALQEAIRVKGKGVSAMGFWKPISFMLDRSIFNPIITTRVAQGLRTMGQKQIPVPLRTSATMITDNLLRNQ